MPEAPPFLSTHSPSSKRPSARSGCVDRQQLRSRLLLGKEGIEWRLLQVRRTDRFKTKSITDLDSFVRRGAREDCDKSP